MKENRPSNKSHILSKQQQRYIRAWAAAGRTTAQIQKMILLFNDRSSVSGGDEFPELNKTTIRYHRDRALEELRENIYLPDELIVSIIKDYDKRIERIKRVIDTLEPHIGCVNSKGEFSAAKEYQSSIKLLGEETRTRDSFIMSSRAAARSVYIELAEQYEDEDDSRCDKKYIGKCKTYYVYRLRIEGTPFYVGQSTDPERRLVQHLSSKDKSNKAKVDKINSALSAGKNIDYEIVDEANSIAEVKEKEIYWIYKHIEEGIPLVNFGYRVGSNSTEVDSTEEELGV